MAAQFVAPSFSSNAFHCPHCGVFAQQQWSYLNEPSPNGVGHRQIAGGAVKRCILCGGHTIWYAEQMVYPSTGGAPPPNSDLSDDIKADYEEARAIVARSPRGAAALLRLCIQKICKELGEPGKNIDDDIRSLVKKGLRSDLQQALDVVRVTGNEAVHPGKLNLNDDPTIAYNLFYLVNLIAYNTITEPKGVAALYNGLLESKLSAIQRRDSQKSKQ